MKLNILFLPNQSEMYEMLWTQGEKKKSLRFNLRHNWTLSFYSGKSQTGVFKAFSELNLEGFFMTGILIPCQNIKSSLGVHFLGLETIPSSISFIQKWGPNLVPNCRRPTVRKLFTSMGQGFEVIGCLTGWGWQQFINTKNRYLAICHGLAPFFLDEGNLTRFNGGKDL